MAAREASSSAAETSADAARAALEAAHAREEAVRSGTAQDTLPAQCAQDPNAEVRVAALNALLQMDGERALPVLKDVLQRRDPCSAPLRRKAVFLVAEGRSAEAEDVLVSVARTDPDPEVRKQAVFWLSQVPTEKAVAALENILTTSQDTDLQAQALFALSQQDSPRAGAILRDYAERSDVPEELREKAVFWIGQHGKPDDVGYLKQLFDRSTTPALKEKILFAVSQSGGEQAGAWLLGVAGDAKQSMDVRKKALFWAGQAGVPIGDLTSLYDRTTDPALKEQLVFVLSQRSEPAAVDKLIDIARNEKDQQLRKKAIFWLGQSDDPRVVKVLQEIIGHE
jgi:HEAT repeat protein